MSKNSLKLIFMAIVAMIFITGCKKKAEETEKKEESTSNIVKLSDKSIKEIGLEISTATDTSFTNEFTLPAKILANQDYTAFVGSLIEGRIKKVSADLGTFVRKGQVLMYIEGLQIAEIKSSFMKSKSNLAFSQTSLERQKSLWEQKATSQKSLQEAQAEYDRSLAEFNAEKKKIASLGLTEDGSNSELLAVRAPIDGIVVERNAIIGQNISPADNAFKIVNTGNLWAEGDLNESNANILNDISDVKIKVSAYPESFFSAKIAYKGQVVDEKTRAFKIRASVQNAQNKLKPEMFAEMIIKTNKNIKCSNVPTTSIIKENGKNFMFIALGNNTFEKRAIENGNELNGKVPVYSGLKSGEQYVSKGVAFLKAELLKSTFGEEE